MPEYGRSKQASWRESLQHLLERYRQRPATPAGVSLFGMLRSYSKGSILPQVLPATSLPASAAYQLALLTQEGLGLLKVRSGLAPHQQGMECCEPMTFPLHAHAMMDPSSPFGLRASRGLQSEIADCHTHIGLPRLESA